MEQACTSAKCQGTTPVYNTWWEMYPTNGITFAPVAVKPGDKIKATVTYKPATSQYVLSDTDVTTGKSFMQKTTCAANLVCSRASAEWIIERPTGSSYFPLANFGSSSMTHNEASDSTSSTGADVMKSISGFPYYYNITMINDPYTGETLAAASDLNSTHTQFAGQWFASR